jgi:serine/threonine protein kinase/tetratricopeptide (TPR) repeat protein
MGDMNPQRWQRVEEIFHQALERPASERLAWLEGTCAGDTELRAEVVSLLESDSAAAGGFVGSRVEQAVLELRDDEVEPAARTMAGRQIGPYKLIRELGRGGMGAVYLAARADEQYESEVALKLVRPGLDTEFILRRFRRERQILARLQHPNIARLFDGGTTEDDIPYLVMEYVDGVWINQYAAKHHLNVEARLRLFLQVCDAVEYAHRNFIVHRDLKPGNILIDATGVPKLLDFGISKLLHAEQRDAAETQGVGMMTPDYASPEQILGEPVMIASDVYSLGAVLYELLTGARPHRIEQRAPLALERAICLDPTVTPSAAIQGDRALARRVAGDLDNIVLRAMQKDPERRYASVEHLADDLRRHLEHRPVVARPDSLPYRARKFVRRNQIAVALAVPVALALIGGGLVAVHETSVARERFQQVRKLATTFVFDVEDAAHDLPGAMKVRQLIARTGLEYLDNLSRSSARDWDLKRELATAYLRIGDVQGGTQAANLGDFGAALASFGHAGKLLDEVLQHAPSDRKALLDRMTLLSRASEVYRHIGDTPGAVQSAQDGLRRADGLLAANSNDIDAVQYAAVFHLDLARLRQTSGNLDAAAQDITTGLRLLQQLSAAKPDQRETRTNIAASHARLGAIQAELGQRDLALASYRSGVEVLEALCRRTPNDTHLRHELMLAYSHVGDTLGNPAYDNAGDLSGAHEAYGKMVEQAKTLHEADPADVRALGDYGIALLRVGIATPEQRKQEKRVTLERAHEFLKEAVGRNPRNTANGVHKAWTELELGDLSRGSGDRVSAARYYQAALATSEAVLAINPADASAQRWLVAGARKLAEEQARSDGRVHALATLEKALRVASEADRATARSVNRRIVVARAWETAGSVYAVLAGDGHGNAEDLEVARKWYERAVAEWQKLEGQTGFLPPYRKEMDAASEALAALRSR